MLKKIPVLLFVCLVAGSNYRGLCEEGITKPTATSSIDSIWQWYQLSVGTTVVTSGDSVEAYKKLASGSRMARKATEAFQKFNSESKNGQKPSISNPELIRLFEDAVTELHASLLLNANDVRTKNLLKTLYSVLGSLYDREKDALKSIEIYKALTIIDKRLAKSYFQLAYNQYALKQWAAARENFNTFIDIVLDTVWTAVDSTSLFSAFLFRGQAEIKLNLPFKAIESLEFAQKLAATSEWQTRIQMMIDRLKWDDGNIYASDMRDSLARLESAKNYAEAREGYQHLLDKLFTESAKNYTNLRIANLDFWYLEQKEAGIQRLFDVVQHIPIDSNGAAIDSTQALYLERYSLMSYQMGLDCMKKNDMKLAFIYFNQATVYDWSSKGRSFLRLAELTYDVFATEKAIEYCHQALNYQENLNDSEIKRLYQILQAANRQTGNFDEAEKWYLRFLQM